MRIFNFMVHNYTLLAESVKAARPGPAINIAPASAASVCHKNAMDLV